MKTVNQEITEPPPSQPLWWQRPDLCFLQQQLHLGGHNLAQIAASCGTPSYLYSAPRIKHKLQQLTTALANTGLSHRIFYAMKANRFAPLLTFIRSTGLAGIDACSPEEVRHALGCGFTPADISYTATSVSNEDLNQLLRFPDLLLNCDSISTIRRVGERAPGRDIGLRINPAMGIGYNNNSLLQYSGATTTKFGIYREHLQEALEVAARYQLRIVRIHFHVGIGYLTPQLPLWEEIVANCCQFIDQIPTVTMVNMGGGLGLPHNSSDPSLDLQQWSAVVKRQFGPRGITVAVEPGDYIVKDSGVLLLQVNTVERKQQVDFIGVNGGFNLAIEPAFYKMPCEPVPVSLRSEPDHAYSSEQLQTVTIAGNINEAVDIWAENIAIPALQEEDFIAFINAGGYASSMSSNHCMRGQMYERLLM